MAKDDEETTVGSPSSLGSSSLGGGVFEVVDYFDDGFDGFEIVDDDEDQRFFEVVVDEVAAEAAAGAAEIDANSGEVSVASCDARGAQSLKELNQNKKLLKKRQALGGQQVKIVAEAVEQKVEEAMHEPVGDCIAEQPKEVPVPPMVEQIVEIPAMPPDLAKAEGKEADAQIEYEKIYQENAVTKALEEQDVKYKTQEAKSQPLVAIGERQLHQKAGIEGEAGPEVQQPTAKLLQPLCDRLAGMVMSTGLREDAAAAREFAEAVIAMRSRY